MTEQASIVYRRAWLARYRFMRQHQNWLRISWFMCIAAQSAADFAERTVWDTCGEQAWN